MKSYEETVETVFNRIKQYQIRQKRKKQIILRTATPICCIMLLGSLCYGLYKGTATPDTPQYYMDNIETIPAIQPTETENVTKSENIIRIHPFGESDIVRMDIGLFWDDYIPMTLEEITNYYGYNIVPDVPADLIPWEDESHGIFKRNKGTGEIYWDQNIQNFSNDDSSRNILVETAKGRLPFQCCIVFDPETESSVINGENVAIGLTDDGEYDVWFMHNNVGFYIFANGIKEDELIHVIESLIQ